MIEVIRRVKLKKPRDLTYYWLWRYAIVVTVLLAISLVA
jgi:hypothetical protein